MTKILEVGSPQRSFLATHRGLDLGFTLIELMVVLAIMVLLVAAMPLALNRMLPAYRFRGATDQLVTELQQARMHALAQGQVVVVACKGSSYVVQSVGAKDQRVISVPSNATLTCSAVPGDRIVEQISLFPDGSAAGGVFSITDGKRTARIELSSLTGRVRLIG